MKKILIASTFAALLGLMAGCGTAPSSPASGSQGAGTSSGGSGVEVFGTIDAGVSRYGTR
ncbi:hypothetical protein WKW79_12395 [Variovorax robiniae]|uniref:Uncharacterized protein n=1 Tax=Variovorax robiniae TaxID=1836199 RepID=A0ABU8X6C2_9BURK